MNSWNAIATSLLTERPFLIDTIASIIVLILTLFGLPLFLYRGCTFRPRHSSKSYVKLLKTQDNETNQPSLSTTTIGNMVVEVSAGMNCYGSVTFELLDNIATLVTFQRESNIPSCVHGKGKTFTITRRNTDDDTKSEALAICYDTSGHRIRVVEQRPMYDRFVSFVYRTVFSRRRHK